jgi:DNA replication protein DnaC
MIVPASLLLNALTGPLIAGHGHVRFCAFASHRRSIARRNQREFERTPINERLVRDLAQGDFLAEQRNCVLVGGTGTGKTHLAIAIARSCIRAGKHGRFYNTVDLVNRLEAEARGGQQGRIAEYLTRWGFVVLDELGYLPLRRPALSCCFI